VSVGDTWIEVGVVVVPAAGVDVVGVVDICVGVLAASLWPMETVTSLVDGLDVTLTVANVSGFTGPIGPKTCTMVEEALAVREREGTARMPCAVFVCSAAWGCARERPK
jgi:hypothetical protein